MPPPKSLPRDRADIARLIDLAFVKFERRLHECLAEAESRILTESATAQQYMMGQLAFLKSNILKSLENPEVHTAPRPRPVPMAKTEPLRKRSRPDDDTIPSVPWTTWRKRSKHNGIGIEEARREIAAELAAQKEKLATGKKARNEEQVTLKIATKKQKEVGKGKSKEQRRREETLDNKNKEQKELPESEKEIPASSEEEDDDGYGEEEEEKAKEEEEEEQDEEGEEEDEEDEEDIYSSESEKLDDSDGYGTPPSPTPARPGNGQPNSASRSSRRSLPDLRSSYPKSSIPGLFK